MQLCGVVWSLLKGGECIFAQCPLLSFYFLPFFLPFLPSTFSFYLFTLKKFIDGGTRASLRSALSIQLHEYQIYEFFLLDI